MAMNKAVGPGKRPSAMSLLAGRIANLAIPATANNIFAKLQQAQMKYSKNFGMASDPRQWFMESNPFSDQIKIGPATMTLQEAQQRIDRETRTELANRTGSRLPQFLAPLKKGIASAVNLNNMQQETYSDIQEQRSVTNNMYVQDQRWPVTLNQILGSKMLTPEQLKAASIQNIPNYINVSGGTQTEKAEMYYMFQRMMLEGFIRGVDITKDFKGNGGRNPKININLMSGPTVASNKNNIGVSNQQGGVKFNLDYMRRNDDNVKMSLFYHEVGHELLDKEHANYEGIMKSGGSNRAGQSLLKSTASYNAIMDDLFRLDGKLSDGSKNLRIPVQRGIDAKYDPSWYPSVNGEQAGYDPTTGAQSPVGGNDTTTNNNYQSTINQTTINPFQPMTSDARSTMTSALDKPDTMDVPDVNLPNTTGVSVNQGFAAGVQQVGQQQSASLQGIAGALNQLRAG